MPFVIFYCRQSQGAEGDEDIYSTFIATMAPIHNELQKAQTVSKLYKLTYKHQKVFNLKKGRSINKVLMALKKKQIPGPHHTTLFMNGPLSQRH